MISTAAIRHNACVNVICVLDALGECNEDSRNLLIDALVGYYSFFCRNGGNQRTLCQIPYNKPPFILELKDVSTAFRTSSGFASELKMERLQLITASNK